MSHKAFTWAAEQRAGGPGPKAVLLVLADRADENHSCFPGQELIAFETEQSVSTVRRQLKALEDKGLIRRERRENVRGHRTSDRYILPVNVDVRIVPTGQTENPYRSNEPIPTGQLCTGNHQKNHQVVEPTDGDPLPDATVSSAALTEQHFNDFWSTYPRKVGKAQALTAWRKAVNKKRHDPALILERITVQARLWHDNGRTVASEKQYLPHASTWLTNERYNDEEPDTAAARSSTSPQAPRRAGAPVNHQPRPKTHDTLIPHCGDIDCDPVTRTRDANVPGRQVIAPCPDCHPGASQRE